MSTMANQHGIDPSMFRIYQAHSELLQATGLLLGVDEDLAIPVRVRGLLEVQAAAFLNLAVGTTLTAYMVGFRRRDAVQQTVLGKISLSEIESVRLRLAHALFEDVARAESADMARAWLIGSNPWLSHGTPAQAIREDRHDEVRAAAQAFINDQGGA